MQIHQVKRKTKNKKTRAVGRGGKRGKTSGKGHKGQNARAGTGGRPELRDFIKKLPKLRGRGVNSLKSTSPKPFAVSVGEIDKNFADGEKVSPETLVEKSLAKRVSGKSPKIKIVSDGEITKKVEIHNCALSAKAREKVEKAGGKII